MMSRLKSVVQNLKSDVSRVLIASGINKLISLLLSIVIVRILSKEEYGLFSFAFNKVSIIMVFSGFGITSGILQFCSESISLEKKKQYYKFGLVFGVIANLILCLLLFLYGATGSMEMQGSTEYLFYLVMLPLVAFCYEFGNTVLRTQDHMVEYANSTNINSVVFAAVSILLAVLIGVYGYIIGYYTSYIIAVGYIMWVLFSGQGLGIWKSIKIQWLDIKPLLSFSIICMLTNSLSNVLGYIDLEMVGQIIPNAEVLAAYKIGSGIPSQATFITAAIVTAVYPNFAKNQGNYPWLKTNISKLLLGLLVINGIVAAVLFFGAELIIQILYGPEYSDAVLMLKISSVGYLLSSTIRIPFGTLLLSMRKVSFNLVVCAISGVLNVILDLLLIPKYGSMGAVFTSVIVILVSGVMSSTRFVMYMKSLKNKRPMEE
ncbi:MAG: oligosaccharide flippase family protein [Acutalibacteraceae bacterium]